MTHPTDRARRGRIVNLLAALLTLPALVLGVGFVFHTSLDPTVFSKYSTGYFIFLAAWWILVVPGAFLFGRFLFGTQTIHLPSGRDIAVRPLPKLLVAIMFVVVLGVAVDSKLERALRLGATTGSDHTHPFLQNIPKPNRPRLNTNEWNFRGDPIARIKPDGTYRIVVLGGSTVFCGRLPYEQTHAYLLQERLREDHPDISIEVLNAGADWHTSEHSLIKLLFHVQDFDPDLLIVYHGINDLCRSFVPDAFAHGEYRNDYGHYDGALASLLRPDETRWKLLNMRLGFWFSDLRCERVRVKAPGTDGEPRDQTMFFPKAEPIDVTHWPSLEAFRRNMRDLAAVARSKGIDVVMASQPYLYRADLTPAEREILWFPLAQQQDGEKPSIESMIRGMDRFNETSRAVARNAGVGFVDLEADISKTTEFFIDDVHYTPAACRRIAEAFARHIDEAELIERRMDSRESDGL